MTSKIPNYNTLSTLIDRLSVEVVKYATFSDQLEIQVLTPEEEETLKGKIKVQEDIRAELQKEVATMMQEIIKEKDYDFITEKRTFT